MKKTSLSDMTVLYRNKWTLDVFTGKGWDNHSCFQIYKGHLKLVGGQPITDKEYSKLTEFVRG